MLGSVADFRFPHSLLPDLMWASTQRKLPSTSLGVQASVPPAAPLASAPLAAKASSQCAQASLSKPHMPILAFPPH